MGKTLSKKYRDELESKLAEAKSKLKVDSTESVDHPSHYNFGKIEVIDAIEDWRLDFCLGNVVKYVARAQHKGNELEDLRKAMWYLNHRISQLP